MTSVNILIVNPNPAEVEYLSAFCQRFGSVHASDSIENAIGQAESRDFNLVLLDSSFGGYPSVKGLFKATTTFMITGADDEKIRGLIKAWPPDYHVDAVHFSLMAVDQAFLGKMIAQALDIARLKLDVRQMKSSLALSDGKVKEVYSEIKEIKGLINEQFIRELEKRISLEARFIWLQRERQKIEKVLRKIYAANDVSSLLDIVPEIKDIVQASGATIYILDENETLGKYIKPLVWDDAFLPHPEFSKFIARLDAQDFAAGVARYGQEINLADLSYDKRMSKRYLEHLKAPLKSLLGVPIMFGKEVIGVIEVYNKTALGLICREGFSREDQKMLRGLSEHIAIAMTKLNLIQFDALTALLRPDPFFEKVIQKINSQSKRRREEKGYALVMGDVDWFKNYNDRNGHEAGNRLLRELAGVLKMSIREDDLLCRYGGEEFLFFLTGVKSLEDACQLTERIRKNVEAHYFELQEFQPRTNLTMSFGVTIFPKVREALPVPVTKYDLKQLAHEADLALAEAKGKWPSSFKGLETGEKALLKNKVCSYGKKHPESHEAPEIRTYNERLFKEKRNSERHFATTIFMYKENGSYKVTKTVDLSLGGAKVISETRLPLEKTMDSILILNDLATPLKSHVVYSEKAEGESPYYFTGLKFLEMSYHEKKDLEGYLDFIRKKGSASN